MSSFFADLREVLDEETYEAFGDKIDEMHITADKRCAERTFVPYV